MKVTIQRNHDANDTGGGSNAGLDISDLGLEGDDVKLKSSTTTTTGGEGGEGKPPGQAAPTEQEIAAKKVIDDKILADTEVAKKFGGVKLDDKGNAVDAMGNVIKSADEIQKANAPVSVTIDDKTYKLDDKGNAIDETGKIVKTKAEIDALEADNEEEISLVEELKQKSGLKFLDAAGKEKIYEDSPEGYLDLANDIGDIKAKGYVKKFFDTYPDVEDFANHLKRGGTKEEYFTKQSSAWSNVQFDPKNDEQLTAAVVAKLTKAGLSKAQAELTAKMYKDTDKLTEFGKEAYTSLVGEEKAAKAKEAADEAAAEAEDERLTNLHWQNVNQVIKKGTLNNITIPEVDREPFFNYLAIAVDNKGNSKDSLETLPLEQELQLKYLKFKGFNLKALIDNAVSQARVKSLRDRAKAGQQGVAGGKGPDKGSFAKPNADVDVSMDKLEM